MVNLYQVEYFFISNLWSISENLTKMATKDGEGEKIDQSQFINTAFFTGCATEMVREFQMRNHVRIKNDMRFENDESYLKEMSSKTTLFYVLEIL